MFTGIVQGMGTVRAVKPQPSGVRFVIDRASWRPEGVVLKHGDSVCNSGVCLTVVTCDHDTLEFDVIAETLRVTTLGQLKTGSRVNLESSVTPMTAMGGHFLQGHVDGVGDITHVLATPEEWRVTVRPPAGLMDYIVPKGSVAIDGVSLTVASVSADTFDVALIPTTLQLTTLGQAATGGRVNVETDIISKTIVNFLKRREESQAGVTMDTLRQAGFSQ